MLIMRQKTKRSSIPLIKSFITHKKQRIAKVKPTRR